MSDVLSLCIESEYPASAGEVWEHARCAVRKHFFEEGADERVLFRTDLAEDTQMIRGKREEGFFDRCEEFAIVIESVASGEERAFRFEYFHIVIGGVVDRFGEVGEIRDEDNLVRITEILFDWINEIAFMKRDRISDVVPLRVFARDRESIF